MVKSKKAPTIVAAVLAAGLAVLMAICPRWLFALQDDNLLATSHSRQQETAGRTTTPEDIYMVRALRLYSEMYMMENISETKISKTSKREKAELLPRVQAYVQQMQEAGMLDDELLNYLEAEIFPRESVNFSHSIISTGYEMIICNFGMGTDPSYHISFLTEMKTDKVISAWFKFPPAVPYIEINRQECLQGTIDYLGLAELTDWEWITGEECYEQEYEYADVSNDQEIYGVSMLAKLEIYVSLIYSEWGCTLHIMANSFHNSSEEDITYSPWYQVLMQRQNQSG